MRLALYQPDIPQNTGTLMRSCACLDIALDIIEPCGFLFSDRTLRRSGMDYIEHLDMIRHNSWTDFKEYHSKRRIVLMTTKTDIAYTDFEFQPDDILMAGRESAGVPNDVHDATPHHVTIPMHGQTRSLNVAIASTMILGEALRQEKRTEAAKEALKGAKK